MKKLTLKKYACKFGAPQEAYSLPSEGGIVFCSKKLCKLRYIKNKLKNSVKNFTLTIFFRRNKYEEV